MFVYVCNLGVWVLNTNGNYLETFKGSGREQTHWYRHPESLWWLYKRNLNWLLKVFDLTINSSLLKISLLHIFRKEISWKFKCYSENNVFSGIWFCCGKWISSEAPGFCPLHLKSCPVCAFLLIPIAFKESVYCERTEKAFVLLKGLQIK